MKSSFEIVEQPDLQVAYIEHVGPYDQIGQAFPRLMAWAGPRGVFEDPGALVLGVYLDDPEATPADQLRSRACVTVPPGTTGEGDVGTMTLPGGLFAVGHFEIDPSEYGAAWSEVYHYIPQSGHVPDERMCYEVYLNDPATHPEGRHVVDIYEPVRPA